MAKETRFLDLLQMRLDVIDRLACSNAILAPRDEDKRGVRTSRHLRDPRISIIELF